MGTIQIRSLTPENADAVEQAAQLLTVAFAQHSPAAWETIDEAREELREMLAPERIIYAAYDGAALVGWVGGIPAYRGRVWELHPLAVTPARQRQGIGRMLVGALEREVAARGGLTI